MFTILLSLIVLLNGCSVWNDDTFYIIGTLGEQLDINLNEIFRNKINQKYTVSPPSELYSISSSLELIEKKAYYSIEQKEIISSKLYKNSGYLDVANYMTILSKTENNYFIEYNSVMFENTPDIDKVVQLTVKPNSACYDIVQVNLLYIIECNDVEGDYFALLNQNQISYFTIKKLERSQQSKLDQLDDLILRTLYHSLELYQIQNDQIILLSTLDSELLKQLTKDDTFELLIVDFQFHTNNQITILNKKGQFIRLKFMIQSKQWELYEYLLTQTTLPYAYDYSWKFLQLVIISDKAIYLRQLSTWSQKENLKIESNDKVYLTQNQIILLKQKQLLILNQNFLEIQEVNLQTQGFLTSYQAFDSFSLFDQQNFYAYTVNQDDKKILRFKSNQLINDYILFKISQQPIYNLCEIKCYYKVVDKSTKDIYEQFSISNSFFKGGFLLDEQDSIQFTQPFVGNNLKLEFTPNQIVTLQFSRNQKLEILNAGDPKEVIYRRLIPELGLTSYIEQNKDLKITGYLCNLKDQQFQCKTFIQTHDFIKLLDSPLQQWFAQFYTYLAVGKENNIDLYCNCNDQFQISLLTTLTMESNIKDIKHTLSYLLILIEKEVLVYQINNMKQRLVHRHSAEKIFTSTIQDLVWIYDKKTLYLLDISDNSKLLWFTYLNDYDDIDIGIAQNQFILLTKQQNLYQGFVYDYKYQKFAYIVKEIDLIGYTQVKICQTCNQYSNFVYLEAQKNGFQVLLIYRLDQIAINSLFLELSLLADSQISSSGQNVFITNSKSQILQQYLIQNEDTSSISIQIDEKYQQIKSCEIIKLNGLVSNSEKNKEIKELPISLINRGIQLFQIVKQLNFTYQNDGNLNHCFDLGQSWYSGQAFDIELQSPFGDIKYEKTLIKQTESIDYSESIIEFDKNNLLQLMNNKIILLNKADFKTTEFHLDNQYSFTNILFIKDNLIYVEAIQNQQYVLKLIQYKNSQFSLQEGLINTDAKIKKAYLNNNYFFIWVKSNVLEYDTKNEPQNLQNYALIKNIPIPSQEGSIEFQYIQKNDVYQIIFLDQSCLLQFFSFQQTSNSLYNSVQDIAEILRNKLLYDPQNQNCRQMFLKEDEIVVVISGTPSYKFKFVMQCSQNNICDITQFNLISEFQQYGKSEIDQKYPSSYLKENILSINYQSNQGYDILLYDLQSLNNNIGPKLAIAQVSSIIQQKPIITFVYNYNEQLHLLVSAENSQKLQHYLLKRSAQVCIEKPSVTQEVKFLLKNSNQEKMVNLQINISPNVPPDPDPTPDNNEGFPLWATLTIVAGVVLLVGVGILIWCYKKKKYIDDTEQLIQ
ncbi:unnamed protein product [Paramecium sonneborni]|uniref:Transmembrane protein n=1 Tax=Paramecium sonneborni TaxID=65129 RepID=A0A8S1R877_9CILI|nr:unnamed protein product [Paramecium sonneborni]